MSESAQNVVTQDLFDTLFRNAIVKPLLNTLPRNITPNFITSINIPVRFTLFLLSYLLSQHYFSTSWSIFAIFTISTLFISNEIIDDLDGMQARATGQYSKFGEIFDHVLDAFGVPILGVAVPMALHLSPLAVVAGLWGPTLIYHLQLSLYRRTGIFVEPQVSGARSACAGSITVIVIGILNLIMGRYSTPMCVISMITEVILIIGCLQNISFYAIQLWKDHNKHRENREPLYADCAYFIVISITYSVLFLTQYGFHSLQNTSSSEGLMITPFCFTIITTGYSTVVNGQEVQNIVLNKPRSTLAEYLSISMIIIILGLFIFDQMNMVMDYTPNYFQTMIGILLISFQCVSLHKTFKQLSKNI